MATKCLLPQEAEKLKKAFISGEISTTKLFEMKSSKARIDFVEKYLGDKAEFFVAKIEKAYLVPRQKQAMQKVIWDSISDKKQLYVGLTLEQSKKMFDAFSMNDLRKMTQEERTTKLTEYVDKDFAEKLSQRFEDLKKTGNLQNWEERVLGSKEIHEDKKLKGNMAKLEALDDLGVLNPKQLEDFMQTFAESKLGVELEFEQSKKLSQLINKQRDAFNKVKESGDWTGQTKESYKNNLDYRIAMNEVVKYTESLKKEKSAVEVGNMLVEIGRNNLLGSPITSPMNSGLYQIIPSLERAITKRLTISTIGMKGSLIDKVASHLSKGIFVGKDGYNMIYKQLKLGLDIYDKTGMDTSRMSTLDDGYMFFGEKEKRGAIPVTTFGKNWREDIKKPFKEAKGIKAKSISLINSIAEITSLFPKYFAGGTDTSIAQISRASTAVLGSRETADFEKRTNQLPKGMTEKQRAEQLFIESMNPATKDIQAQFIRTRGIMDAHQSNNTQEDGLADHQVKLRNKLGIGKFKFGTLVVPMMKITTTTVSKGLQLAIGVGPVNVGSTKAIMAIYRGSKHPNKVKRAELMNKGITNLIGFVGLPVAGFLFTLFFLDDDDYIPPYIQMSFSDYKYAEAQGGRPGSIRIGGHWLQLKYLPLVGIQISSIMSARQSRSKDKKFYNDLPNMLVNYAMTVGGQFMETPFISGTFKLGKRAFNTVTATNVEELAEKSGTDLIWDYTKVRMLPAILSRDILNAFFPKTKYNFLGQEVEGKIFGVIPRIFRDDKMNNILLEYERLDRDGFRPSLTNPSGSKVDKAIEKLGEEKYLEELAKLQRNYAEKLNDLFDDKLTKKALGYKTDAYKRVKYSNKEADEQKKYCNKVRQVEILDRIEDLY